MNTKLIQDNLNHLIELIKSTPEKEVLLRSYTCGSTHCALGWACSDPFFQAQGLTLDGAGYPVGLSDGDWEDGEAFEALLEKLFGDNAHHRLFASAFAGEWDDEIAVRGWHSNGVRVGRTSDKTLALLRLRKQLEIYND